MTLVTHQTGPEGRVVRRLLIEETLPIEKELYLGIVIDRAEARPVFMASAAQVQSRDLMISTAGMGCDAFQAHATQRCAPERLRMRHLGSPSSLDWLCHPPAPKP